MESVRLNRELAVTDKTGSQYSFPPLLWLVLGAVCVSFSPVFVKWVGQDRLGPTAIGFWRTAFGGLALMVITAARSCSLRMDRRAMLYALLAGAIFALDLFVWHRSVFYVGAGMSTILGNTQVFFVSLLAVPVLKEKLTFRYFVAALVAITGLVMLVGVIGDSVAFDRFYVIGVLLGLATGLIYAHFLVVLKLARRADNPPDSMVFITWMSLFAALFLGLTACLESGPVLPPDLESTLVLIGLGVVAQALGWWIITYALARVSTAQAALTLLIQPTLATIWGILFFMERFSVSQYIGAAITLAAIYYGAIRNGSKKTAPQS